MKRRGEGDGHLSRTTGNNNKYIAAHSSAQHGPICFSYTHQIGGGGRLAAKESQRSKLNAM
jgi:hypothetical protein